MYRVVIGMIIFMAQPTQALYHGATLRISGSVSCGNQQTVIAKRSYADFISNFFHPTPLHHAKTLEEAQFFIDLGHNVNAQESVNGDTPLHRAPASLVPWLIYNGADLSIKNKEFFRITDEQNPTDHFFSSWEHVYYDKARKFWKLFNDELCNMDVEESGHYGHRKDKVYKGLTAPMHAAKEGDFKKVLALQVGAPDVLLKQIKALKLIALRSEFDSTLCGDRKAWQYVKIYKGLCIFEAQHTIKYFPFPVFAPKNS